MADEAADPLESVDRQQVFGEIPQGVVERIAPGFFSARLEAEHLERYTWAARWVKHRDVLDVACGTGYGSSTLLKAGARSVVGVDLHAPALAFASQHYSGPAYIQANALQLPLKSNSFDLVVSLETIEHLSDSAHFLRGLHALLRKDGLIVLSSPNKLITGGRNPYHINEMTLSELFSNMEQSGFRVTGRWGQFWKPDRWKRIWQTGRLREVARGVEQRSKVRRLPALFGFTPLYWCILGQKRD